MVLQASQTSEATQVDAEDNDSPGLGAGGLDSSEEATGDPTPPAYQATKTGRVVRRPHFPDYDYDY